MFSLANLTTGTLVPLPPPKAQFADVFEQLGYLEEMNVQ